MTTPTGNSAPLSPAATGQPPTPAEQGKTLLRRLIEEVINQGRLEVTDELFSPELAAAARRGFTAFRAAFSDWHMELVDLVAEDDKVVGRFRCSGTHSGPWLGIAPTGRRFEQVDEVAILRMQDGRFVDYWALEDTAGRLQQLDISLLR
jgi:predicted ester cyclase